MSAPADPAPDAPLRSPRAPSPAPPLTTPQPTAISWPTVVELCAAEGLHAAAVIAPPAALDPAGFDRLLADGVGDMIWLERQRGPRADPRFLLPTARAILAVAMPHQPASGSTALRRARYAAGKDYHHILRPKLGRIGAALNRRFACPWDHRAAVDSAPLNERTLARLAGLGWIGRNALVISPDRGSWQVLGFLLTEAPLAIHHGGEVADRCGTCTRCEDRCPTRALTARRVLSERCISYLTIEHAGVIPRALAERFQGWWFGCDLCQEVCPWNRFAPEAADPRLRGGDDDAALLAIGADDFDRHFAGRAIRRIGYQRFRRNLLVALFSLGRRDECAPIIAEDLPVVRDQARECGLS